MNIKRFQLAMAPYGRRTGLYDEATLKFAPLVVGWEHLPEESVMLIEDVLEVYPDIPEVADDMNAAFPELTGIELDEDDLPKTLRQDELALAWLDYARPLILGAGDLADVIRRHA